MEFLVANVEIVAALKGKVQKLNKQIMIKIKIQEKVLELKLLVVKGLNLRIIMGCDALYDMQARINMENKHILLTYENQVFKVPFMGKKGRNK